MNHQPTTSQLEEFADEALYVINRTCWVNGRLVRDNVEQYARLSRKYHFAGYDTEKHDRIIAHYQKMLEVQERGR